MPKTKISEFSATPGNNTDIDGINISEGCPPSGINDAIRELMAQLKDFQAGTAGDSFNGPIGSATPAAGTFTNLSASGTFALTGDQVQISEGGTGQTTANAAFNALAPSQSTHAGKYLKTDGTNTSWDALDISTADITGTLPIANGGTGLTALGTGVQTALGQNVTGSGGIVLASSPSLTTPNLGTPSAVTLTNATGLPLSTGVTGTLATTNGGTGLTSFTANGVVYASSSSALTTGSALTFDGNKLAIQSGSATANRIDLFNDVGNATLRVGYDASNNYTITRNTADANIYLNSTQAGAAQVWQLAGSEQMRLTSTGLGIGTSSPSSRLEVSGSSSVVVSKVVNTNTAGQAATQLVANVAALYSAAFGSTAGGTTWAGLTGNSQTVIEAQSSSSFVIGAFNNAAPIIFAQDRAEKMRLDTSGNLGLGVTPSASWANYKVLQIGEQGVISGFASGAGVLNIGANFYWDGSGYRYLTTNAASLYQQNAGAHNWRIAASGTAGDPISFTQAMTLDASGNLGVGTTSPSSYQLGGKFAVAGSTSGFYFNDANNRVILDGAGTNRDLTFYFRYSNSATITSDSNLIFQTGSSTPAERARITSGGNLLLGTSTDDQRLTVVNDASGSYVARFTNTTSSNANGVYINTPNRAGSNALYGLTVANSGGNAFAIYTDGTYGTISDINRKKNVETTRNGYLADLCSLRVVKYHWKEQEDSEPKSLGFIAQEIEQVFAGLVQTDNNGQKMVKQPVFIPMLVKAIQEQQAIITDLRARVAQLEAK